MQWVAASSRAWGWTIEMMCMVDNKSRLVLHRVLRAVTVALLTASYCPAAASDKSYLWPVEDAMLRFRIEKDDTYSQVPDVYLSSLEAVKGPSDLKKPKTKGRWPGTYYRLNRKVYKEGIRVSAPGTVIYKHQKEYGHFVAFAGISDRADPNASISFEVWADKRRLFKSDLLTKQMPPAEINVRIPSGTKRSN